MHNTQRFLFRCGSALFAFIATPHAARHLGYHLDVRQNGDYFGTFDAAACSPHELTAEIQVWLRLTTGCVPEAVAA
jgi:hypothetical protein